MTRRQITLLWGDAIVDVRVVRGPILPTFDPALRVMVETLDDCEPLPEPARSRVNAATVGSAIAHVAFLAFAMSFAHFHPADEKKVHEANVIAMEGYLGRIAEHDGLAPGDVATDAIADAVARDRGRHGGEALREEDGEGTPLDAAGRTKDDTHFASLVPLAFVKNEPQLGAIATSDLHVSPSTLGPKLSPHPRVSSGRGTRGGGGGGGAGSGGASSCVAFKNSPLHDAKKNAWIQFALEDGAGHPVPNERYRVTLPDGTVHEGLTDARGLVCFTGIEPGNAQITFPNVATIYKGASPEPI